MFLTTFDLRHDFHPNTSVTWLMESRVIRRNFKCFEKLQIWRFERNGIVDNKIYTRRFGIQNATIETEKWLSQAEAVSSRFCVLIYVYSVFQIHVRFSDRFTHIVYMFYYSISMLENYLNWIKWKKRNLVVKSRKYYHLNVKCLFLITWSTLTLCPDFSINL